MKQWTLEDISIKPNLFCDRNVTDEYIRKIFERTRDNTGAYVRMM